MRTDKLVTSKQLEEKLQVTAVTLWRWRKEGMPFVKLNNSIRFNEIDVMAWLDMKGSNKVVRFFHDAAKEMKNYVKIEIDGKETEYEFPNVIAASEFISNRCQKLPPQAKIYIANDLTIAKEKLMGGVKDESYS